MDVALHTKIKFIPVLKGVGAELVTHRELRNFYHTNRDIKTLSVFFLLKGLTTSGVVKRWTKQKATLLNHCKMTENCFRSKLRMLKELKLITISKDKSIILESFETAAENLGIKYSGITKIEYNENSPGKQVFQFQLAMDEIKENQKAQLEAINYKINKNPKLKDVLYSVMNQDGADRNRLDDKRYFQEYLLKIQKHFFKKGSDIWTVISQVRAEINRGVNGIKKHYGFKSTQSVSYLKKRLKELGLAKIEKRRVESEVRTRWYLPDGKGKNRELTKYCWKTKRAILFLCDAIIPKNFFQK